MSAEQERYERTWVLLEYEHRPSDGTRYRMMGDGQFERMRVGDRGFVPVGLPRKDIQRAEWEVRRYCDVISWRDGRSPVRT